MKLATKKKRMNIMTSCDQKYAKLIPPQLVSIYDNLCGIYEVHFYLFHNRVTKKVLNTLNQYCETLDIEFNDIYIEDITKHTELASRGGSWGEAAYLTFDCYKYLPDDVDRILYMDAADMIVGGDIGEYYFDDFEGNTVIVTGHLFKKNNRNELVLPQKSDLFDAEMSLKILRKIFNSGSYVLDVNKMRVDDYSLDGFIELKNVISQMYPDAKMLYWGDQGLLAAAYLENMKYFKYPEIRDSEYQPYNFLVQFYDHPREMLTRKDKFVPKMIHFAGSPKPWTVNNENELLLKAGESPYYKIYQIYANAVPKEYRLEN